MPTIVYRCIYNGLIVNAELINPKEVVLWQFGHTLKTSRFKLFLDLQYFAQIFKPVIKKQEPINNNSRSYEIW